MVTDLTNVMYRQTDAVEKLTKIKADSDKQMVRDMKQIKDLAADCDQKAQQLADLEAAAQVFIGMVKEEGAGSKSLLERLREAPQRTWPLLVMGWSSAIQGRNSLNMFEKMRPIADKVISGFEPAPEA